ncbi:MAG: LytR C-terminal domain-containing protein [Acidimicrobiales bacterium]|nr:LytR C-terminal domain-containing protein [Acidimicrobiales bacterium]
MAVGRGVALLVVAVVIGVLVLDRSKPPAAQAGAVASGPTTTTVPPTTSTTSGTSSSTTSTTTRSHGRSGSTSNSPTTTVPPAQVKALVANGTQTAGLAGRVGAQLQSDGYNVFAPMNAPQQVTASVVYYVPGSSAAANGVASAIGLTGAAVHPLPSSWSVSSLNGAQVVVVAGPDLASRFPASSSATTTTTA